MARRMAKDYRKRGPRLALGLLAAALCVTAIAPSAPAQSTGRAGRYADKIIDIQVGELTLESINLRDQTAKMSIGLDVKNSLLPVSLKDFDYRLSLYGLETIEGSHDGVMRIGGRDGSRVNIPMVVNLRSIPGVVWSAFSNRGRLRYDLDAAFTLPLFVFEKRFDRSFSGEVPLKTLVDAASILRARRLSDFGQVRF